jgi:hypothetical protein
VFPISRLHGATIVRFQSRTRNNTERLQVSLRTGRINVEFVVTLLDEVLGANQAFGAGAATLHLGRSQCLDIGEISVGIGLRRG